MPKNRQIYQSDLIYCGPTGSLPVTGALQSSQVWGATGALTNSHIAELYRIQKADQGWSKELKPVNQFGELGQIDLVSLTPPSCELSYSYIQSNLVNENLIGLTVSKAGDANQVSCVSGILNGSTNSKNYFIKSVAEGSDAIDNNQSDYDLMAFGNAFLSSYTAQGRVLDFPTVDVSFVALNVQMQHIYQAGTGFATTPAINAASGTPITGWNVLLPTGVTSYLNSPLTNITGLSVLRPGDITLNMGLGVGDGFSLQSDLKVQSYSLSFNLGLEDLAQLGSKFYYAKLPKFPVEATLTVNALAGDFQTGSLLEIYNNNNSFNPSITITSPGTSIPVVYYQLKGAKLDNQKYGLSIGSNKTVDYSFKTLISGPTDTQNGVFMSGICANI